MASATLVQDCPTGNSCPVPFAFRDHRIRTVAVDDRPWFVAKDVCAALDIDWSGKTLNSISDEWQSMGSFPIRQKNGRDRVQRFSIISEPAVYKLAFRSNKPEADAFTNWVASEVLPAIRKTGQFAATSAPVPIGPLTPAQCRHLHDVIDAKVSALPKEVHRAAYAEAWTRFNRHFRIAKYEQLPQEKFSDGLAYLISMQVKAAQKAFPAAEQKALPCAEPMNLDALVADVRRQGSVLHEVTGRLWDAIWQDVNRWRHPERPATLTQLNYAANEAFSSLGANIELCRRLAFAADVAYREMHALSRKGA